MITIKKLSMTMLFIAVFSMSATVYASAAGTHQLRLKTGFSKRTGETAFSYLVTWRKGDEPARDINGLMFVDGTGMKSPTTDTEVAYKIAKALNAAIVTRTPQDRGAVAKTNKAEMTMSNKEGFELSRITTRDYSNQALSYSIPNKSFKAAKTAIAIDIVYSAAVEYIAGFSTAVKQETAGGFVTVTIDNDAPIKITTDGKTTKEIEKELAAALGEGARYSSMPIYPNFIQIRSKNYKPFDGGEVQIPALNARSISIDVNDSGLGVLTKFEFTNVKQPVHIVSKIPYIIAVLFVGAFGYIYLKKKKPVITGKGA
jgi:hypothetical protein